VAKEILGLIVKEKSSGYCCFKGTLVQESDQRRQVDPLLIVIVARFLKEFKDFRISRHQKDPLKGTFEAGSLDPA
jgi:hypothetical protein